MSPVKFRNFETQILFFNGMYKLPVSPIPSCAQVIQHTAKQHPTLLGDKAAVIQRLKDFKKILAEEVEEVEEIIKGIQDKQNTELAALTELADWLGDIQVYCASEMAKFGIPLNETLDIIMASNFSKLGTDGQPIYDERGKVMKGPGYWKPEPKIHQMLEEKIQEAYEIAQKENRLEINWREDGAVK